MPGAPSCRPAIGAFAPAVIALLMLVSWGCSTDELPTSPEAPEPEATLYELLGSSRVVFERFGEGGALGQSVMLVDGRERRTTRLLSAVDFYFRGAVLSPTADRLAGLALTDQSTWYDAYVTRLDGTQRQQLSSVDGNWEGPPAWSPSGESIFYAVFGTGANGGIFEQSLQGGGPVRVSDFGGYPNDRLAVSAGGMIAFFCEDGVCVVPRQGGERALLYANPTGEPLAFASAVAWSPDGSRLAVSVREQSAGALVRLTVKVIDAGTGVARSVVERTDPQWIEWSGADTGSLCWLPDGERLVFSAPVPGNTPAGSSMANLFMIRADGTGLARLTAKPGVYDTNVSCAP